MILASKRGLRLLQFREIFIILFKLSLKICRHFFHICHAYIYEKKVHFHGLGRSIVTVSERACAQKLNLSIGGESIETILTSQV